MNRRTGADFSTRYHTGKLYGLRWTDLSRRLSNEKSILYEYVSRYMDGSQSVLKEHDFVSASSNVISCSTGHVRDISRHERDESEEGEGGDFDIPKRCHNTVPRKVWDDEGTFVVHDRNQAVHH